MISWGVHTLVIPIWLAAPFLVNAPRKDRDNNELSQGIGDTHHF